MWWSWFIIGALGLNVSTYVLAGVEAGMLTTKRFGALSTDQIQMHQDSSWSKVNGWVRMVRRMVAGRKKPGGGPVVSWVWVPLFVLSVLSWAFALSGLTMETEQSYRAGSVPGVSVAGSNATNFNLRSTYDVLESAYEEWRQDRQPRIPLIGALYSMPGATVDFNMTTGNELPSSTESPLFLAPQAEVPVTGTAWGIALRYSCRPIRKLEDFKILSKRLDSRTPGYIDGSERDPGGEPHPYFAAKPPDHYVYDVPGVPNATISVLTGISGSNIQAVAEIGISSGIYNVMDLSTRLYEHDLGGLGTEEVLEFALWQGQSHWSLPGARNTIPELEGEYLVYALADPAVPGKYTAVPMAAVGVQCVSATGAGSARLDGLAGTFHDFRREDPMTSLGRIWLLPRLTLAVPAMLLPGVRGHAAYKMAGMDVGRPEFRPVQDVLPWLATGALDYRYVETVETTRPADPEWIVPVLTAGQVPFDTAGSQFRNYLRFAEPEDLQRALQAAYRHVAARLMYHQRETSYQAWRSDNVTAAVPWTTLRAPGEAVPALLVLVALSVWALGCAVLGALYSFRRRWDAYFSVRSLYWYCKLTAGVDPTEAIRKAD